MKKLLALILFLVTIVNLFSCTLPTKSNTKGDAGEKDVPVSKVTLDTANIKGYIGDKHMLSATTFPDNATDPTVTWSSDSPEIASVSDLGLVELKALGETIITATTANGKSAYCYVTVEKNMDDYKLIETTLTPYNYTDYIKIEAETFYNNRIKVTISPLSSRYTFSDIAVELEFHITEYYYNSSTRTHRDETLKCGFGEYEIPLNGVNNNWTKSLISISGVVSKYVEK